MSTSVDSILEEVGTLPKEDRFLLMSRIFSKYGFPADPKVEEQWNQVADERWNQAQSDPSQWMPASEGMDLLRKEFGF